MKYWLYIVLAWLIAAVSIIWAKFYAPGLFGFILGAGLTGYGYAYHAMAIKHDEAKAEKAYQLWQAEMNERANRNAPSKFDW